jgi:hypothetical protein
MKKTLKLKKLVLFAVWILFSYLSYSQENFLPGFVINNSGDTLKGFIDYRNWAINPKVVDFKSPATSHPTTFIPTDIKEFSVKDEIYVSGIVEVENTSIEENRLEYDSKLKITVDTIFLQTLLRGKKGLYYYMNNNGRVNFYVNKDGRFELLVYKKYLIRQGTTSYVFTKKDYIGQLNEYLKDCLTIRTKIENTSYAQKDLIKLFQDYYKCSSSETGFQRKAERVHLEIGALSGVSLTKLKFNSGDPEFDYLENTNYKLSTNFSGSLFFDIIMPRNQGKLSLNNELLFSVYKTTGQYEFTDYNNTYKKMTTEFGYSYLKINNLLRYRFLFSNLSLFINSGISTGIRLSETKYVKKEFTTTYSGTSVSEGSPLVQTKYYEQGFLVGAGIKSKKLSFEVRLEKGDGMINVSSINAWATRYYILIGYRFK